MTPNINVPEKFMESGLRLSGNKTKGSRVVSMLTKRRMQAETTLRKIANDNNTPLSEVVTKILLKSLPAIRKYIQDNGEIPNDNKYKMLVQAVLLRAKDIATISKALDTDDNDSVLQIEAAEQDAINNKQPDASSILPYDVQAALKLALENLAKRETYNNRSGKLQDFMKHLKRDLSADSFGLWVDDETEAVTQPSGNLFDWLNKLSDSITKLGTAVGGAIGSTKDGVTDLLTGVKDTASDIGSDSINKSISTYLPYIIALVAAIILIIVTIIYAKRK